MLIYRFGRALGIAVAQSCIYNFSVLFPECWCVIKFIEESVKFLIKVCNRCGMSKEVVEEVDNQLYNCSSEQGVSRALVACEVVQPHLVLCVVIHFFLCNLSRHDHLL